MTFGADPPGYPAAAETPGVLVIVCRANVCRSPLAEFLLQAGRQGGSRRWRVLSAGTAAVPGESMCTAAAAGIADLEGGPAFAEAHLARPLSAELVHQASLIVTASGSERSQVALLAPEARDRTFTLLEAAHLSTLVLSDGAAVGPGRHPRDLARSLHQARGRPPLTRGPAILRRLRPGRVERLDIPDVHGGTTRSHRAVRADVARSVLRLQEALRWIDSGASEES